MPAFLLALVMAVGLLAGPWGTVPAAAGTAPAHAIDHAALFAEFGFECDNVGYVVFDLDNGRRLLQHNDSSPFIPASVAKLPTTLAALDILGAEHRFETSLLATARPVNGVIRGDLYLRGGGDPFLFTEGLEELVLNLKAAGVRRVSGRFYYDASLLRDFARIDASQPEAATYNAAVSALTVNFNRVQVRWKTNDHGGSLAEARSVSRTRALPVDRITFGTAALAIDGAPFLAATADAGERWLLSPKLPGKGRDWLPVRNPGAVAAEMFRDLARIHGIELPKPVPGVIRPGLVPLARHQSNPLDRVAGLVLEYSNNLAAELVGLAASQRLTGERLDLLRSSTALTGWLRRALPGVDWSGFYLANHSGLSSASRVTPEQIAAIVRYALANLHGGADYSELLAPVGWEDEVNAETKVGADLRVRAKTGTMSYATGLAGYLQSASGRLLGFAVFIGDLERRAALDAAADPRVLASPPAARDWTKRARALEEALVREWLVAF